MDMTTINTLNGVKNLFEEAAEEFLTKGYYRVPDGYLWRHAAHVRDPIVPEFTLRKFLRKVAKENKRPFVHVCPRGNYQRVDLGDGKCQVVFKPNGIVIEMPKRKFLAPLIHCLEAAGFSRRGYSTLFGYVVYDEEFAKQYLEFFQTRDEFRKALRLPPK